MPPTAGALLEGLVDRLRTAVAGRYTIERELGRGGMATVYLAQDLKHRRQVAIKVLKPELAAALGPERFLREIEIAARLQHPHILPLHDSGDADGFLHYVMPYVEGESLRERLRREGQLPMNEALRIVREVADGLDSAHRHGVIHRDIKPENILLEEGHAVIADFGIARAIAEAGGDRLTASGLLVGTPVYMSPEQMLGRKDLDGRSDIYSLGCVLYELLAGEPPFNGPTLEAIFARRLRGPPQLSSARAETPEAVKRVLERALADSPEQRFATAAEFGAALLAASPPTLAGSDLGAVVRLARRPRVAIPALAGLLAVALGVILPQRHRAARERARALLSRAAQLSDSSRFVEAYQLLGSAAADLPDDSEVTRLMPRVAEHLTITSEPPGARVYLERFTPAAPPVPRESVLVGVTPIRDHRVPRSEYRMVVVKDGFVPFETLVSNSPYTNRVGRWAAPTSIAVTAQLVASTEAPSDMVAVPGGLYELTSPGLPVNVKAQLDDYFIDKYEVSNAQYKVFVASGSYRKPETWARPGVRAELWQRFTDRTGLPGPRSWVGQDYSPGRDRYPVTDVSWYETSAYCAFVGKMLPTVFQWEKAARNGLTAPGEGVMMPWGHVGPGDATSVRANFSGTGPAPVDAYRFGMSSFGAYNMAGNVTEWTANPVLDGYGVIGGSWQDPLYLYSDYGSVSPFASAPSLGFRCAKIRGPSAGDQGAFRIYLEHRTPHYQPVGPAAFQALLAYYRYDRRAADAHIVEATETPDWVRQTIRYVAMDGDTALAYLYLPKHAAPPFQTMVYVCGLGAFGQWTVRDEVEATIGANIKAGRAALAVVFRGMAERSFGPGWEPPQPSSVRFRDLMVLHATEMRRAIDYLQTRDDIDLRRLSYVGLSWGAGSRLVFAAVDDRFRAVVFIGGGIDERVQPTLPEAANFNFAPYIKAPKLLLNGRDDEEHPWYTRALPLWNLLREPKKLVLVEAAGHVPPAEVRVPNINQFLDETLGPVAGRR